MTDETILQLPGRITVPYYGGRLKACVAWLWLMWHWTAAWLYASRVLGCWQPWRARWRVCAGVLMLYRFAGTTGIGAKDFEGNWIISPTKEEL